MKRNWLVNLRKEKGYTQEVVSEKVGIERPYYTQIETGSRRPSVQVAQKIAQELNFDWTIFFANECSEKRQDTTTAS
ncbi:helix-turn-helix transcriptional regulator [Bacillus tianshenii]|nr:helix-turn-helix transcriptional regulator [Bacillus tianshenii]